MTHRDLPLSPQQPPLPPRPQPPFAPQSQPQPQTWYQAPAKPPGQLAARLQLAGAALLGAVAGWSAVSLASNARAYCDAGWEGGGRFEMTFLLVLMVPGCALLSLLVAFLLRRLPLLLRAVPVLLVLAVVVVWFFATKGTLDGYHGDSGLCGADNVPPWWPAWLPS